MLHQRSTPAVAGAYTIGAVAGASLSGFALLLMSGLLSPIPVTVRAIIAAVLLLALLTRAIGVVRFGLPQRTYQIPRETFQTLPTRAAFRFALELGTGVRTYVTSSAPYGAVAVTALCLPTSLVPALLGVCCLALGFGLGRSFVVAAQSWRRAVAVEVPALWLRVAEVLSLTVGVLLAVRLLV